MTIVRILFLVFLLTTLVLSVPSARAQTTNPCDNPKHLPPSFFEVPPGPQGDWRLSLSPDTNQSDDPLVPVVVDGVGAIQGPANRRGLRLGCGVLKNRSDKEIASVRLRWILIDSQNRALIAQNGYNSDTVLVEGHSDPLDLTISANSFRRTDFSIINFVTVTERLTKNGILHGDYYLFIGMYEVRFGDGSVWVARSTRSAAR
jgi:hypothetical protein